MCCVGVHGPSASAHFCVSKLREREIKDMPRRALSRCEIPGDKIEGKEELEGNGKEMKLISFDSLYFSCFLPQETYADFQVPPNSQH